MPVLYRLIWRHAPPPPPTLSVWSDCLKKYCTLSMLVSVKHYSYSYALYMHQIATLIKMGCIIYTFKGVLTATNPKLPLGCIQTPMHGWMLHPSGGIITPIHGQWHTCTRILFYPCQVLSHPHSGNATHTKWYCIHSFEPTSNVNTKCLHWKDKIKSKKKKKELLTKPINIYKIEGW